MPNRRKEKGDEDERVVSHDDHNPDLLGYRNVYRLASKGLGLIAD